MAKQTAPQMTATISEFARIVGVNHAAVVRAVQGGIRLSESVIRKGEKTRIIIALGCYEWISHKQVAKYSRKDGKKSAAASIIPRDVSAGMDRHYSALMKQLEYDKACGRVIPVENFTDEVSDCLRTFRDILTNIPLLVSEQLRPLLLGILREGEHDLTTEKHKLMDDAALQLR